MPQLTEKCREIMDMPVAVFNIYLQQLTSEDYQKFLAETRTVPTDKRGHNGSENVDFINLVSRESSRSSFSLKLSHLAHTFYDQDYFRELVDVDIPKGTIAELFGTTVDNVNCQIALNNFADKYFEKAVQK